MFRSSRSISANRDGVGILTQQKARDYFALQKQTAEQRLMLTCISLTPNLFELLDDNRDGLLYVRELRTAWERLRPLETTDSSDITSAILQPCLTIQLVSGPFQNEDSISQTRPKKDFSSAPLWFQKMDRNKDGDISRGVFLDSREDYNLIDSNGGGLICLAEAQAYEQRVRPSKKR